MENDFDALFDMAGEATETDLATMRKKGGEVAATAEAAEVAESTGGEQATEGYRVQDYKGDEGSSPEFERLFGDFVGEAAPAEQVEEGAETAAADKGDGDEKPAEGAAEAATQTEETASAPAISEDAFAQLSEATGHSFKSIDDVQTLLVQSLAERDVAAAITELRSGNTRIDAWLTSIANGEDETTALLEAYPELQLRDEELLDDQDDREALKRRYIAQGRSEKKSETQAAEAAKQAEHQQTVQAAMRRLFSATVAEFGLNDTAAATFEQQATALTNFQQGVPPVYFRTMYLGINHEKLLEEAVNKAKIDGRNEAIRAMQAARDGSGGEGVPFLTGSAGSSVRTENAAERQLDNIFGSNRPQEDIVARFAG